LDEYTLIEAQLGVNWVGEWVVEILLEFMYFGLGEFSDEKLCITKLNGVFLTTIVPFSGSASCCQIIILFFKINFRHNYIL
jgi:hypothetical protein